MKASERILVLGIGNMLWADEGFGIRVVEALDRDFALPDHVGVMDGGTQGLYLLPHIENLDALIIVDAIDYGLEPGSFRILRGGDVPAFLGAHKMSLHQTGFQDVLATAQLMDRCPRDLVLIGVQPAVDTVLAVLRDDYGIAAERRSQPGLGLIDPRLSREAYEAGRPSAEAACRIGDPRVLGLGA